MADIVLSQLANPVLLIPFQFVTDRATMLDMHTFQAGSKPLNSQTENEQVTKFTPNILPCRIHHDGPIESPDRFWITQTDEQGKRRRAIELASQCNKFGTLKAD